MTRTGKWLIGLGGLTTLIGGAVLAVMAVVPGDDELAEQAEQKLEQTLGVKVSIGSLSWIMLPVPAVILQDVTTQQDRPVKARRIVAYVHWRPLLDKVVSIESVELDGAQVPQLSLRAFAEKSGSGAPDKARTRSKTKYRHPGRWHWMSPAGTHRERSAGAWQTSRWSTSTSPT